MRQGGFGSRGRWPGNGPYRHLPPWERPGWVYGRGTCWYETYPNSTETALLHSQNEGHYLKNQKRIIEKQLIMLQEHLAEIEDRLSELDLEERS